MYTIDVHVHTCQTSICGKVSAKQLVHLYKKEGYSGIVITDHYYREYFEGLQSNIWEEKINAYLQGYRIALEEGKKIGIDVLLGMELRFDENVNDYLVYGIDEDFLYQNQHLYEMTISEFKERIQGTQILVYQAHPFRTTAIPANPQYIHGIEVYNGNPRHNSYNHKALEYALKNQLKMISGSDFHRIEDVARGGIVLSEFPSNSAELVEMLWKGRIVRLLSME